ncbi:alpha/beta hydrolase [Volucribacter amazonae]|uniref:alpha/beta hydrolase n=1 Tax=Volucribacter amazonae TaxID=256731 RepID=UPI0024435381|nr:alpha/beta hydrolase [Volucribacter amazonae]
MQQLNVTLQRPIIDNFTDIIYHQVVQARLVRQLRLSLLVPRTVNVKPVIIYFPGGGFLSAEYNKFIQMRMALAERGFVVACAEYRVIPDTFPAPVQDGKAAIRYLRAFADQYGINPQQIGVLGDSAGGWLAQMLALTDDETDFQQGQYLNQSAQVQAAVSLYGLSNLLNIGEGLGITIEAVHQSPAVTEALLVNGVAFNQFAGANIDSDPAKALYASPMGHLQGNKPPLLLMHGEQDRLVSPKQSEQLYHALLANHQPVQLTTIPQAQHGDEYWYQQSVIDYVCQWFIQQFGLPKQQWIEQEGLQGRL